MTRRGLCVLLLAVAGALASDKDDDGVISGAARAAPFFMRAAS